MLDLSSIDPQILKVENFEELVSTPFLGEINAICWNRKLEGNFEEIVSKVELIEGMMSLSLEELGALQLSKQGQLARDMIVEDFRLLESNGAAPMLNLINQYERDDSFFVFPTDVYSFHVDRSPVPFDTFLCTYYGESSEILPNSQAIQKVLIPELLTELRELYGEDDGGFESFLIEHFFDLHYQAKPKAKPISLGLGHMWRLAIDHPESQVPPCIHRAPKEKVGQPRLMMIC